jgi:hypothetical protein
MVGTAPPSISRDEVLVRWTWIGIAAGFLAVSSIR